MKEENSDSLKRGIYMEDYKYIVEVMLKHLDEGIIVADTNANITLYNEPATNIAGITPHEAIGKNVLDIFRDLTPETSTFYKVLKNKEPILNHVQTYLNYQGKKVSTLTSTIPLIREGEIVGALEVYRDLTQVKELSEKIINLQSQLFKKDHKKKVYCGNGTTHTFEDIIGEHKEILKLKEKGKKVADSSSPILVYGETGTGKELVVQAIHNYSKRRNKPFIAQNCAAIPKTLLESLLFGTCSGSFTGAKDNPGLFELAHGGTLFLDEINSMDIELQGKLLRVLQDGMIRRIGGSQTFMVDVRIIASTNEIPSNLVEQKKLRNDLYYRLNVIPLTIPSLIERKEDIPLLISHFINVYNNKLYKNIQGLSSEAMAVFCQYHWPGNVRELRYTLEGIMNFVEGEIIQIDDLPVDLLKNKPLIKKEEEIYEKEKDLPPLVEAIKDYEKNLIQKAIEQANGNCAKAARILDIPRQTLHNKVKKLSIEWKTTTK
ncbi:MAG: sigma 54-interacting transcriptional regulator [Marinisporobacter sp.]|jgi:arginine utilization regulatory protein|nr:sigma 54-interacting transcriptional regulator [Marinisporobacter sp.]